MISQSKHGCFGAGNQASIHQGWPDRDILQYAGMQRTKLCYVCGRYIVRKSGLGYY